ncbi:MAG: SoxR reducing system RseC family protein [Bacteroidales bacterium]
MNNIETQKDCSIDDIKHDGIVTRSDDRFVYVSIVAQSACSACSVKGACNVSDLKNEIIEVEKQQGIEYNQGERVQLFMEKSLGTKAVFFGYLLPFILVLISLIIAFSITSNQGLAGLVSLGILIPYYLILYAKRNYMKKAFVFRISERVSK